MLDAIGNELHKGQMVQVDIAPPHHILAQVQEVTEGGLLGGRDGMVVPGQLILVSVFPLQVQPNQPVVGVVVVQQPRNPQAAQESKVSH